MSVTMPEITLEQARAAKRAVLERFGAIGCVVGVGITRLSGQYAVKVNLEAPIEAGVDVPDQIDGVPVRVEVTGTIRAR